jgi:hypothetical protein
MPVKPGEELGFVQVLRNAGLFPLPVGLHTRHPGLRYATPFLVVPAVPSDPGTNRALPGAPARLHFAGIHVVDDQGHPTATPLTGQAYTLIADVANLGSGAAYTGIVEFYVGSPDLFDQAAVSGSVMRAHGYNGFVALPNSIAHVRCPVPWRPVSQEDTTSSVLVQVYDLCLDPLGAAFNARTNRHVGRQDLSDFSGTWDGIEAAPAPSPALISRVRLVITQTGLDVTTAIFQGVVELPNTPQHTVTGHIESGRVQLHYSDAPTPNALPFSFHQWTLTLLNPDTLHFEHRTHFTQPEHPDRLTQGDLHRI